MASVTARKGKDGQIISYQIKVTRGRDKLTGKQLTPYTTTYNPPEGWSRKAIERDLQRVMGEFEAACKRGEVLTKEQLKEQAQREAQRVTFEKYVDTFLKSKSVSFACGTAEGYKRVLSSAVNVFGKSAMIDINRLSVKEYIADIQMNGKNARNGQPYAYKTIMQHFIVLHSLFESAVEDGVIEFNPMAGMKHPKPRKDIVEKKKDAYDDEQIQYIIQCLNKEPLQWKALVMFAIDSGCRRGEIVGLRWEEIDFKTGRVNICRNAQYTPEHGTYISTPKSGKSRTIQLNRPALAVMAEWKRQQTELLFGQGIVQSGFCFTQDNGQMMHPHTPTGYFGRFGKRYNLPGLHPHLLRHSMATLSISHGADIVSVSQKLGHAQVSTTLNIYAHANEDAQQRANAALAEAIYK